MTRFFSRSWGATGLAFLLASVPAGAWAAIIVIANRTTQSVPFDLTAGGDSLHKFELPAGELISLPVKDTGRLRFKRGNTQRDYVLDSNAAYYFGLDQHGGLDLQRIGLAAQDAAPAEEPAAAVPTAHEPKRADGGDFTMPAPPVIPVKILVDEEEMAKQSEWERRLRARVAAASKILEQHAHVKFEVVAVDTWRTDNNITEFNRSLREFEQKVDPAPARLAIGFTSQYQLTRGKTNLGGTRGILHSHLLIREWSQVITEPERLEVLVHEIGHFLGAVHSPEPDSVMRPNLGDRKARLKAFRIGFDPVNTLAMSLVGEELRTRPVRTMSDFSVRTQLELRKIYAAIDDALPEDPAASHYMEHIDAGSMLGLVQGTRLVIKAVVMLAEENAKLPPRGDANVAGRYAAEGDELADRYVRQAAALAGRTPGGISRSAFLAGLAIALDRSDVLRQDPLVGSVAKSLESDDQRKHRLEVLGNPTARGRHDLVAHFAVSAALTSIIGPTAAESVGLAKECRDARGGSGFSFADYQADLAGIRFAQHLIEGKVSLPQLAAGFSFSQCLPAIDHLPEGLTWQEFTSQFGSLTDDRFLKQRAAVEQRILDLPAYRGSR